MSLWVRDEPLSIDHSRRFASAAITARVRFALHFPTKKSAVVTSTDERQAEIEKLIEETAK